MNRKNKFYSDVDPEVYSRNWHIFSIIPKYTGCDNQTIQYKLLNTDFRLSHPVHVEKYLLPHYEL